MRGCGLDARRLDCTCVVCDKAGPELRVSVFPNGVNENLRARCTSFVISVPL